jgi:hypothetical protein
MHQIKMLSSEIKYLIGVVDSETQETLLFKYQPQLLLVHPYTYPYISRSDCYCTDTDSVVLSQQLPDEVVGNELGK